MSNIAEIEAAIERLPEPQVTQLARWFEAFRQRHAAPPPVETWLRQARGSAIPGTNTQDILALTRGGE